MLATKKDLKALQEKIENLDEKVEDLRNRIFVEEAGLAYDDLIERYYPSLGIHYEPKPLERRLYDNLERIEKRQELLMKYLGLKFVEVDTVDKHDEIRKVKEPTPETSSRKETCMKCGEVKPITYFHRNKGSKDGRRGTCKFCISEYMKTYLAKH